MRQRGIGTSIDPRIDMQLEVQNYWTTGNFELAYAAFDQWAKETRLSWPRPLPDRPQYAEESWPQPGFNPVVRIQESLMAYRQMRQDMKNRSVPDLEASKLGPEQSDMYLQINTIRMHMLSDVSADDMDEYAHKRRRYQKKQDEIERDEIEYSRRQREEREYKRRNF